MNETGVFIHPSSFVDDGAEIGEGTKIWFFCHIQKGAKIGRYCNLGQNVNVANNVVIGDHVKIQNNVSVYEGVELEDYVFCGPSCVFTNDLVPKCLNPTPSTDYLKTKVRYGASIGANATIVCGHEIGRHAVVAAGAVVTKNVKDHELVAGVPAKRIAWICDCGGIMKDDLVCPKCGTSYIECECGLKKAEEGE